MREIKFRAWDKEGNRMMRWVDQIHWGNGSVIESIAQTTPLESHKRKGDDIVLMQFTGLKDKNGKEIYEGDVVDLPITDTCAGGGCCSKWIEGKDGNSGHMRRVVEWDAPNFYINPHGSNSKVEVIGNIYENPELLK